MDLITGFSLTSTIFESQFIIETRFFSIIIRSVWCLGRVGKFGLFSTDLISLVISRASFFLISSLRSYSNVLILLFFVKISFFKLFSSFIYFSWIWILVFNSSTYREGCGAIFGALIFYRWVSLALRLLILCWSSSFSSITLPYYRLSPSISSYFFSKLDSHFLIFVLYF